MVGFSDKGFMGANPEPEATKEQIATEVRLQIFRHGEKAPKEEGKGDADIVLSKDGRDMARAKWKKDATENALAFGSPRIRAQETAAYALSGSMQDSLEVVKNDLLFERDFMRERNFIVDEDDFSSFNNDRVTLPQTRVAVDERLDFNEEDKSEYGKKFYGEFAAGKYLPFLFNESDAYAKEVGDTEGSTFSRFAGNVAEIIEKYYTASDAWNKIKNRPDDGKSEEYIGTTLNRLLGTHAGVGECFLGKLIERMKGPEEKEKFLHLFDVKKIDKVVNNGFDYVEGFDVRIKQEGADKKIFISYKKDLPDNTQYVFEEEIPKKVIDELVEEGNLSKQANQKV